MPAAAAAALMARRFRGFLPVVIDVETGGFHASTDALLEIAADAHRHGPGRHAEARCHAHLPRAAPSGQPHRPGVARRHRDRSVSIRCARRCPSATRCSAYSARCASRERAYDCRRAMLVGHNAPSTWLSSTRRWRAPTSSAIPSIPSHALTRRPSPVPRLGRRCLPRRCAWPGLEWDPGSAHSARYDAERTAELFCLVCNRLKDSHQAAEERARALGWVAGAAAPDEPEPQRRYN